MSLLESNGGLNKALSAKQENALLLYINQCDKLRRPCKHIHIEIRANSLLRASGSSQLVLKSWTSRFIERTKCFKH